MRKLKFFIATLIIGGLAFVSCNDEENNTINGEGSINVHLTDSPFPIDLVSSTYVTIDKVEIRKNMETAADEDSLEFVVLDDSEMVIDLLSLTNGVTEQIASADLDAGYYDMIRLHVVDATVVLNDGSEFDLKIPSGSTSGLKVKIQPEIYIEDGQTSDVLLDFDVSRSFVVQGPAGDIKGFNFKPVVRGVYMGAAGRIEGNVTDTTGTPLEDALVKTWRSDEMEADTVEYISSFTDMAGDYKIIGLREGTYTVVSEMEGYESDTLKDINVVAGESVMTNFELK